MMRNFRQKGGLRNILQSRPVLILLGLVFLFSLWGLIGFVGKLGATRENRKVAENRVEELKQEQERLSADIAKLETDSGVEESIRTKFGLAKEGENVIVVVEDQNPPEVDQEQSKGGFWSFFTNWLQ